MSSTTTYTGLLCNAFNRVNASDPGTQCNEVNQVVFYWVSGDTYEMAGGSVFSVGSSIDLVFNTEDYNFNYAKINLSGWANDYDWASGNENSSGYQTILGDSMYGAHTLMIYNSDFTLRYELNITPID